MAEKVTRSTELLVPVGAGTAFVRRELRESRARAGKTFRVQESSVLGRVRSFLPQLAAAEVEVVDIEDVSEDEPHIALDLAIVPLPEVDGECSSSEEEGERGEGEMVFPLKLPGHTKKRTAAGIEELCH